jgi:hypothetical protein
MKVKNWLYYEAMKTCALTMIMKSMETMPLSIMFLNEPLSFARLTIDYMRNIFLINERLNKNQKE